MERKIDADYFAREVYLSWAAISEEFGKTPEELARLDKCKYRKADIIFEHLQQTLKIPPGDPLTVAKALGDYIVKAGYATSAEYEMLSDNEIMSKLGDIAVLPVITKARSLGLIPEPMVAPEPSCMLFVAALKKLCNLSKVEKVPVPDNLRAPENIHQEIWHLVP